MKRLKALTALCLALVVFMLNFGFAGLALAENDFAPAGSIEQAASDDGTGILTGEAIQLSSAILPDGDGSGIMEQAGITASAQSVTGITVTGEGGAQQVHSGQTLQMMAEISPEDADNQAVTWSVEGGTGEASIDQDGLLSAQSPGTVTVRATAQDGSDVYGETDITIVQDAIAVQSIIVSMETNDFLIGESVQMEATVLPVTAENKTVIWSVTSGSSYASIDETSGLLSCNNLGTVTVRADAADGSGVFAEKRSPSRLFSEQGPRRLLIS
jgi:uncharacterized protein YjdB